MALIKRADSMLPLPCHRDTYYICISILLSLTTKLYLMSTFKLLVCITIILSITAWWCNICYNQLLDNRVIEIHNYYIELINSNPYYHIKAIPVYNNDCYIIDVNYGE